MSNNQTYEYVSQEKEYFMLREEIMIIIKSYYENLRNMVAVYPVIMGFAWTVGSPYFMFAPMILILAIYYLHQSYWVANCKMASYMMVVLKDVEINWEFYNHKFNIKEKVSPKVNYSFLGVSPHYFLPLIGCYMFALLNLFINKLNYDERFNMHFISITAIMIGIFLLLKYSRKDFEKLKKEYMKMWEDILKEKQVKEAEQLKTPQPSR